MGIANPRRACMIGCHGGVREVSASPVVPLFDKSPTSHPAAEPAKPGFRTSFGHTPRGGGVFLFQKPCTINAEKSKVTCT